MQVAQKKSQDLLILNILRTKDQDIVGEKTRIYTNVPKKDNTIHISVLKVDYF